MTSDGNHRRGELLVHGRVVSSGHALLKRDPDSQATASWFVCQSCGRRGADIRPDFDCDTQSRARRATKQ
jgi:hypothetical protein